MKGANKFSSRTMRRRGHVDGRIVAQETIDRFVPRLINAEAEREMEAFAMNKMARLSEQLEVDGAPKPALQQYVLACTAGLVERIHEWRAAVGREGGSVVH